MEDGNSTECEGPSCAELCRAWMDELLGTARRPQQDGAIEPEPVEPEDAGFTEEVLVETKAATRIVVGLQPEEPKEDLQKAFKKFLKKKKKAKKKEKKVAEKFAKARQASTVFRDKLRQRFVERIRHYIGVPYAKRYHDPEGCTCEGCTESGRQLYHDPLFLDCCALIRRAVADLRHFFGFKLGKWNQNYQFDTLPLRVGSVNELEPGDLIFWSGTYFNPKIRKKVFNLTHVEIFIGGKTGEAVIGSRQQHKWVMEYDSYVFTSKSWKCHEIFYCKIDTWLEGILEPQHPELWQGVPSKPSETTTKSVFHVGDPDCAPAAQTDDDRVAAGHMTQQEIDLALSGVASSSSSSSGDDCVAAEDEVDEDQDEGGCCAGDPTPRDEAPRPQDAAVGEVGAALRTNTLDG